MQVAAWSAEGRSFDVVLVDAPRAGLKRGHAAVAGLAARAFGLCSCNVKIVRRGRRPDRRSRLQSRFSVRVLNMFPGTEHVELFGWFER